VTESPTAPASASPSDAEADTPRHRYTAELAGEIEGAWQHTWAESGTFNVPNPVGSLAPPEGTPVPADKMFVQDMFPYPSGEGLHVGHPLGYIATDVYARYYRMTGRNVLHALGFDSFGLPAEQYAIQTGTHPRIRTEANIVNFRRQLGRLGFGHDSRRSFSTTDVDYYKWTQWIFLQIYNAWFDPAVNKARPIAELVAEFDSGARALDDGRVWSELSVGERADVIVAPLARQETEATALNMLFNRGYGSVEYRSLDPMFKIAASGKPESQSVAVPDVRRTIPALVKDGATPVQLELNITQAGRNGAFAYDINGQPFERAIPLKAKLGETQLWTVKNTTPWSHPLHIHGYFFQVLDEKGEVAHPIEWKDTVSVPFKETLRLLVRFDERPGQWMVHCHILDHAEGGLMTTIIVGDAAAKPHSH